MEGLVGLQIPIGDAMKALVLPACRTLLSTTLVIGSVVLLNDILYDKLPAVVMSFLPTWVWLLPREGLTLETEEERVPCLRIEPRLFIE